MKSPQLHVNNSGDELKMFSIMFRTPNNRLRSAM
jgi:hypothetical protein